MQSHVNSIKLIYTLNISAEAVELTGLRINNNDYKIPISRIELTEEEYEALKEPLPNVEYWIKDGISTNDIKIKNNILYINEIPIQLVGNVEVYIDADNGNDDIADGTSNNPYKTFSKFKEMIPFSGKGNLLKVHITGNFGSEVVQLGNLAGISMTLYFENSPTFCQLYLANGIFFLYGDATIDYSLYSSKTDYDAIFYICQNAQVQYFNGTLTILGSKDPITRGVNVQTNSLLWLAYFNNGFLSCQNCTLGLYIESCGNTIDQYGSNSSMISYNSCTTTSNAVSGGQLIKLQW